MRPVLLCGLAACVSLLTTMPVAAAVTAGKTGNFAARAEPGFRERAAAIIAVPLSRADRADNFKLASSPRQLAGPAPVTKAGDNLPRSPMAPGATEEPGARPLVAALARALQIGADTAQRRSLTLGFDSGPSSAAPLSQATERDARTTLHDLTPAGACMGRMPAFSCGADDDGSTNDSVLSLALAYTF